MSNQKPAQYYGRNHPKNRIKKGRGHTPRPANRSMPLLLMAGILIVLGVALQIMRLTVLKDTPLNADGSVEREIKRDVLKTPIAKTAEEDNRTVFEKLHEQYPDHKRKGKIAEVVIETPVKKNVSYLQHNPVWGTFNAPIDISLFVDHTCKSCRVDLSKLLRTLKPHEKDVRVIMKYAPVVEKDDSAGIFGQMAQQEGVFKPYLKKVLASKDLSEKDFFLLLEESGISLARQRVIMRDDFKTLSKNIQLDVDQFKRLEKTSTNPEGFAVYLNGYRLGKAGLEVSELSTYISKLKNGESFLDNQNDN